MKLKIPPPLQALIIALLMWLVAQYSFVGSMDIPFSQAIMIVFILAGILVDALAITAFIQSKTTVNPLKPEAASKLVVSGVYKITRNPMYVGMVFLLSAWCVYLGNALNVLWLPIFIGYITQFQIKPEEQALDKLFGETYIAYKARVRRWI